MREWAKVKPIFKTGFKSKEFYKSNVQRRRKMALWTGIWNGSDIAAESGDGSGD